MPGWQPVLAPPRCRPRPARRSRRRSWPPGPSIVKGRTCSPRARGAGADGLTDPAPPEVPYLHRGPADGQVIRPRNHRDPLRRDGQESWSTSTSRRSADPRRRWMACPRPREADAAGRRLGGYDYVHSVVDDHAGYSEILPTRRVRPVAGSSSGQRPSSLSTTSLDRACYMKRLDTASGIDVNCDGLGATPVHPPALPMAERQGRTIQPHPGPSGLPAGVQHQRASEPAPLPWLEHYNTDVATAPGRPSPVSRLLPT